ncbi:MAG: SPOR domain-containing protein [Gammaproteobacteria bacterium]
MEKKTTQRIVGILVVIALVIILMPLLLDKNEAATQVSSTKAPPFPDQQNQSSPDKVAAADQKDAPTFIDIPPEVAEKINKAANGSSEPAQAAATSSASPTQQADASSAQPQAAVTAENVTTPADTQTNNATPAATATAGAAATAPAAPSAATDATANNQSTTTAPTDAAAPATKAEDQTTPATKSAEQTTSSSADKESSPNPYSVISSTAKPVVEKIIKAVDTKADDSSKSLKTKHHVRSASATKSSVHHDMDKLKKTAWAVQLGSFKNKDNAIRLADRLRAAGFRAFIHNVKSAKYGPQTRVYIGPEYKQASAVKLSSKIEQQMKMRGFIVSFKPLEI